MTAQLILLGTGGSGGKEHLIYPKNKYGRDYASALYTAEDGRNYLIDAPFTVRGQLHKHMGDIVIGGYKYDEYPAYNGGVMRLERPVALNIESVIVVGKNDTSINGLSALRDVATINNGQPLRIFAPAATIAHLQGTFLGFAFEGRMGIYTPELERAKLKFEGYPFQDNAPTPVSDNVLLQHAVVRQGGPQATSTAIALPGIVYAPAISHVEDNFLTLVADTQPHTVVLALQTQVRLNDNYPYLGVAEFLTACRQIAEVSPATTQVVATGMGDLAGSSAGLKAILKAERSKFGIPASLRIIVGSDGMRLGPDGVQVVPTVRPLLGGPAPGGAQPT